MAKRNRFKQLVHFVCGQCENPAKLGATKLNKVLWYVDTFAYRLWGETVSGETSYVKRQFGPVPKNILKALRSLEENGSIVVRETEYFGRPKREYISLKDVKEETFSEDERDLIKQVVEIVCDGHTAASISDLSHDVIWEAAEIGEEIPVNSVLAAQAAPPTTDDVKWANKIIKERAAAAA